MALLIKHKGLKHKSENKLSKNDRKMNSQRMFLLKQKRVFVDEVVFVVGKPLGVTTVIL